MKTTAGDDGGLFAKMVGAAVFIAVLTLELAALGLLADGLEKQGAPASLHLGLLLVGGGVSVLLALQAARLPHLPAQRRRREREIRERIMDIVLRGDGVIKARELAREATERALEGAQQQLEETALKAAKLELREAQERLAADFRQRIGSLPTLEKMREIVRERAEFVVDAVLEEITRESVRTGKPGPVVGQDFKLTLIAVATRALDLGEASKALLEKKPTRQLS